MHDNMKHEVRMGKIILSAREAKGMTQMALADKVDASVRTIIDIEKNKRNPTCETFNNLVQVLDFSADLVFRPESHPYTPEQDQFIQEFINCSEQEQKLIIAMSRCFMKEWQLIEGMEE